MNEVENGGPAFPTAMAEGMSLRDYFAGQALAGWLASYPPETSHPVSRNKAADIAELSYEMADAMIKAREANK